MKTYSTRPASVQARWHVFDATDKVLGRMATEISGLLQGKHKPIYVRHIITGDYVIVVNASKIRVTGKKLEQKMYRRHSQYPGGLRETPMSRVRETHPDRVIRHAVRGMLPKTILGSHMLRRLKIYAGNSHPHMAQIRDLAGVEIKVLQADLDTSVHVGEEEMEQFAGLSAGEPTHEEEQHEEELTVESTEENVGH